MKNILLEKFPKLDEKEGDKNDDTQPLQPVDSEQIKAVATLIDEFHNIVAKNFNVYGQYEDFSFASTRSKKGIEEKLDAFFKTHFSGDFQLKNSFD